VDNPPRQHSPPEKSGCYTLFMCGRFGRSEPVEKLIERFDVEEALFNPGAVFNIAPGQAVAAVTLEADNVRRLQPFRWGLVPSWAKNTKIAPINARAEGVASNGMFKAALKRRRCLIPANWFYEWKTENGGKQPYCIGLPGHEVFAFAGLWEDWDVGDGPLRTCTIITTAANDQMKSVHNRMPVVLPPQHEELWLDHEITDEGELRHLMRPFKGDLEIYPISPAVNTLANDYPGLINSL
jgi:putative SOS response-associated peptidase YedK